MHGICAYEPIDYLFSYDDVDDDDDNNNDNNNYKASPFAYQCSGGVSRDKNKKLLNCHTTNVHTTFVHFIVNCFFLF